VTKLSVPPLVSERAQTTLQQSVVDRNQSGTLFLDAIRTRLQMFDDAIEQALHRRIRSTALETEGAPLDNPTPGRSLFAQVRMVRSALRDATPQEPEPPDDVYAALQAAAGRFADAILPPQAGRSPRASLTAWKAAGDADRQSYERAKEALTRDVAAALEPFIRQTIARWDGAALRAGTRAALLRAGAAAGSADGELAAIIRRAIDAIAVEAITSFRTGQLMDAGFRSAAALATNDPYRSDREYLYALLRRPGEENVFRTAGKPESRLFRLPLMPLLAGDNPTSNELPSKFLRLTDYQLYVLRQWADGKFYNEIDEGWVPDSAIDPFQPFLAWRNRTARDLDRGVLSNLLGGAFYPGGEVCWVIRNPSIYKMPYRLRADPDFYAFGQTAANANKSTVSEQLYLAATGVTLSQQSNFARGLQPGDLTKYSALPWQADFNECTTQDIDITYELWNSVDASSERDPWLERELKTWDTLWWPAHRPLQTYEVVSLNGGQPAYQFLAWSRGVPQTLAGDLKMVTEWARLGFVVRNPYLTPDQIDAPSPDTKYISVERTPEDR
jgi:hypothetical protein